jgi:DNA/RNA endonuclease G (NUC1)
MTDGLTSADQKEKNLSAIKEPALFMSFAHRTVRFPKSLRTIAAFLVLFSMVLGFLILPQAPFIRRVKADTTAQTLPFSQNWTNTGLITANDNWSGVAGIIGYRGDGMVSSTGVNPQTVVADGSATPVNVIANQTNPNTLTTGGVAEFHITDPVVALQGSGTARAPQLVISLNTTGQSNINVAYNVRDIDGSADNAIQPVALQYRVGGSGNYTNIPAGFIADATTGPSLATLVTPVSVTLPAACENQALVQLRILTTDAAGSDEWVGIDDINITSSGQPLAGVGAANPNTVNAGDSSLLTVTVTPGTNPTSSGIGVAANLSAIGGSSSQAFFDNGTNGDVTASDNVFSFNATVAVGTSGGLKSLPFTVTDSAARTANGNIALTVQAPTNPSGTGSASPDPIGAGGSTQLTFNVTPGANPTSTGIAVSGDLTSIGGSASQAFVDNGGNSFGYLATVDANTTGGIKTIPITITDAQGRMGTGSISFTVQTPANHLTISQIYGGGGNTSATYRNDYVELYNPTSSPINTAGWSIQYSSATNTGLWSGKQPLGGIINPGEYYLIQLASGGATGAVLPQPNISGDINMSGTAGKVALLNNGTTLSGACATGNHVVDFVGYGTTANCREGATNAPAPSNTLADFRKGAGAIDTDVNGSDFQTGVPNPRRTTPIQEIGPSVLSTDPTDGGFNAPKDATIEVDFTEPVTVDSGWFDITCASGQHDDATLGSTGGGKSWYITPNVSFTPAEQCTVTVFKNAVHDVDTDDSAPDTDTLAADYTWSFTVAVNQQAPPYPPEVHLTMGNPSNAVVDINQPDNYLMEKACYALSYNRDKGTPNWVSWHLDNNWYGTLTRFDTFRADPAVPSDWYRVEGFDYSGSGFDRGHMTPNSDRDNQNRIPINQETYLMSNMVPQAPDNNQGPWAAFEGYLRTLTDAGNEVYIVSGPLGVGGTGSNGFATTVANGHVTVPAYTWKVVLVLPSGSDDLTRVTAATRTIAIKMPNVQGIRNDDWHNYLTTVDNIESLTGYDFFANVPDQIENAIEAGTDGTNPPGTASQSVSTNEDNPVQFTLNAVDPGNNPLTVMVTQSPAGSVSCAGITCNYSPATNFNGADSFTYYVSNGAATSNSSTVTINVGAVNDAPSFTNGTDQTVLEDSGAQTVTPFATNISAGPADESSQTVSFTVTNGNNSLFASQPTISPDGTLTYTPAANAFGSATVSVTLKDNGGTANGGIDTSAVQTFNINVTAVNDAPSFTKGANQTVGEDAGPQAVPGWATGISTGPPNESGQTVSFEITGNTNSALFAAQPSVGSNGTLTFTPAANANGQATISLRIKDNGGTDNGGVDTSSEQSFTITVLPVPDSPSASGNPASQSIQYSDAIQTVAVTGTDVDSSSLNASVSYTKDGGSPQTGLPNGLAFTDGGCTQSNNGLAGIGSSCTWTIAGRAIVVPGAYVVSVAVTDGTSQSIATITINVTQEDARADYTGATFVSTPSTSSNAANVTLAATIRDITALCNTAVDPGCDNLAGDIANAKVAFVNRNTGDVLASDVPIGYVTVGDTKTAVVTTNVALSTGAGDSMQYKIGIVVTGYYTRNSSDDDTVITVSKPANGLVTGGGYLELTGSGGKKAGDAGTKSSFGFSAKNGNNGANGTASVLIRRTEADGILHTYQVDSTQILSLYSSKTTGKASFTATATILDITFANDPVSPHVVTVDTDASMLVTMTDSGQGASSQDTIAITLWDRDGGLWFSSNWNGVKTIEQLLGGGNLQVR